MYSLRNIGSTIYSKFVCNTLLAKRVNISNLSGQEKKIYKRLFEAMDKDKDGVLSKEEIREGLKYLVDYHPSDAELDAAMNILDTKKKGSVDFKDFLNYISFVKRISNEQFIKAAFDYADSDRDGYLSKEDLRKSLQSVGLNLDEDYITKIFKFSENSKNGKIDYTNFKKVFKKQK